MNNAQRVVMQLSGESPNGSPTEREERPAPASRLPSWVVQGTPEHTASGTCWCQPKVSYENPLTGDRVYVHRRLADGAS